MTTALSIDRMTTLAAPVQHKTFRGVEWKADGPQGSFRATIATLGVVDHDADVLLPGSFTNGKSVVISAYGHASWGGFGAAVLPVGSGVIGSDEKTAWVDGQFFLDTVGGADTYKTLKGLGDLAEWSFGFLVTESNTDPKALAEYPGAVQLIERLTEYEASPVMRGAGINTGTEWIKGIDLSLADHYERVLLAVKGLTSRMDEVARLRAESRQKEGRVLSAANRSRLASVRDALDAARGPMGDAIKDIDTLLVETEPKDGKAAMSEADCRAAGGTWDAATGMCEMPMMDDGKALQAAIRDAELDLILSNLKGV